MKLTASPTVTRFLTSSSGIFTSNFSSALTTIVIIEIESMSRSSVNDLPNSTVSVAMPVSSLISSARPARTSSWDSAISYLLERWCGGLCVERPWTILGEAHNLGPVDQTGAEADLQGEAAAELRMLLEQPVGRQRDRGGRGVARGHDVAADLHGIRQSDLLGELVDDAHVGLVRDEGGQVGGGDPGGLERLLGDLGHLPDGPAEDGLTVLAHRRPGLDLVEVLLERRVHAHGIPLGAV